MAAPFGYHTIVGLKNCASKAIFTGSANLPVIRQHLESFMGHLCTDINMERHGPLNIEHFGTDEAVKGITAYQLITTSNISLHAVDANSSAYIDVFSCKPYDQLRVQAIVREHFKPESMTVTYLERV